MEPSDRFLVVAISTCSGSQFSKVYRQVKKMKTKHQQQKQTLPCCHGRYCLAGHFVFKVLHGNNESLGQKREAVCRATVLKRRANLDDVRWSNSLFVSRENASHAITGWENGSWHVTQLTYAARCKGVLNLYCWMLPILDQYEFLMNLSFLDFSIYED